ncbi:tetratricopeptide repeat protein [Dysgonomonas sp. 25]|uniref:tetratricopeptide repeat protein n=1 Tax=Dysgonomonas sp. 25 TaxID=2302933 RepID=UPI0013D73667|nr:tetratricopeptide repeat protein [Dysgonomonas sp. 25]NDV68643.1 hypothetical protein [Dysgonomonas sp. 25]
MYNFRKTTYLFCAIIVFLTISCEVLNAQENCTQTKEKRKFDYYFYEAMNAKAQGNYEASFDLLNHCLSIDSTNANVFYELGSYYNTLKKKNMAMDCFRKSTELDKDNFYYAMTYATYCLEFKQYDEAVEIYEELTLKYPENSELYLYLAQTYRQQGNLNRAVETLDRLEKVMGLNEKVSLQKYSLYSAIGKEEKGFAEIQKFIDKYPHEIKYYILMGNLYLQAGKNKEALQTYEKAKMLDPQDPYLISSMAEYYQKTNNGAAAENELYAALISPKMDVETKLSILTQYIGTLYQTKKNTEAANALFDTLMVQHPQEPQLNLMYGNLLMLQQKKDEARFQFQLFADANPTNPTGWEQMLSTTFPDSLKLSKEICEKAISYIPDQPVFYFYLGITEYMEQEYTTALETLKKGISYVDDEQPGLLSNFYGQIGDLYYRLEKNDSAFISYDKALRYDPNNLGVLNNYSYYLSLEKQDLDKAEQMSSLTVKAEPLNSTYLDTYGWVLFQQGAYVMAKIYIENAVKYSQENGGKVSSEVWEHYGDVLYLTGEEEKALESWVKAKEAESTEDPAEHRKSPTLDKKIETKTYIAQ